MKVFRKLTRSIRDSFRNVFRNFSLSLASISCITITLVVVAISIILSVNVNKSTNIIKKEVTIVAFMDKDITIEDRDNVGVEISKLDNIASLPKGKYNAIFNNKNIVLKDKEQTKNEFIESSDTYKTIMGGWKTREDNSLQDAYHVKVADINKIGDTADQIKKIPGITVVKYGEGAVEQLVSIFDVVKKSSYIAVIALIVVTAFLIANTIKITIFSRKREIEIMRLVGASNINIKIPFIIEGLILGVLGSIIPIVVIIYGYQTLYDKFNGQLFIEFIKLESPTPFIYEASLVLLGIGMVVGMFGSLRAVKKYLKV